jgi:polyisoprenoid-binding protein YceI
MKRTLSIVGALALAGWTGLGLAAWTSAVRRVTVSEAESAMPVDSPAVLALADEVNALHADVRALASGMGTNLEALHASLTEALDEHAAANELRLAALRDEVGSRPSSAPSGELADLRRELQELARSLERRASGSPAQFAPLTEVVAQETTPTEPAPIATVAEEAPAAPVKKEKKSFLAFKLPSDEFRIDERRSWALVPSLSRVGFDAKTTLHDFTATTSTVAGELEVDLSKPAEGPRARFVAEAKSLASGNGDRDEAMREHLAVDEHPEIVFELASFVPAELDLAAMKASGKARGKMTIRGVTQEVEMPVRVTVDDARRLCVDGEMTLDLERFHVPVPNKLGLITMDKEIKVWISLRLRANPKTEG